MVYTQILRPVATMVGISSKTWSLNAIDNEYRPTGPESCGIIKPPSVVSISYLQDEAAVPLAYAQRQCWEYAKVRYICNLLFLRFLDFTARNDGDICILR